MEVVAGQSFEIPLSISRAKGLIEPATIELVQNDGETLFAAEALSVTEEQAHAVLTVSSLASDEFVGERMLKVRATVLQNGHLPVISATSVLVAFVPRNQ
jgi:hypothetical protein